MRKKIKNGFSLLELVIVIAIIGVITAIVIPSVMAYIHYGNKNTALAEATIVKEDLNTWFTEEKTKIENKENVSELPRGKNLLYDFIDYELEKRPEYDGKISYGFVPIEAQIAAEMESDEEEWNNIEKYYAKDTFSRKNNALLTYNSGKQSVAIVLPLNEKNKYLFTGDAYVYETTYDNEDKLFKKYCGITGGLLDTSGEIIDLYKRLVTVKFVNYNGALIDQVKDIPAGSAVTCDENKLANYKDSRIGYNFTGWDKPLNNITHDTTITAQYSPIEYNIKLNYDYDEFYNEAKYEATGEISYEFEEKKVTYDTSWKVSAPTRTGYDFGGWLIKNTDGSYTSIHDNGDILKETMSVKTYPQLETLFKEAAKTEDHTINLYPDWVKKKYTISLVGYNNKLITNGTFEVYYNETIDCSKSALLNESNEMTSLFKEVGVPIDGTADSWGWYIGKDESGVSNFKKNVKFDFSTKIRRDYTLYAIPNYKFYIASSGNNWLGAISSADKYIYVKIPKSVVEANNTGKYVLLFSAVNDAKPQYFKDLDYLGTQDGYYIYNAERSDSDYTKFRICRVDASLIDYTEYTPYDIWNQSVELTYNSSSMKNGYIVESINGEAIGGKKSITVKEANGSYKHPTDVKYTYINVKGQYESGTYWYCYAWNDNDVHQRALMKATEHHIDKTNNIYTYLVEIPTSSVPYTGCLFVRSTNDKATIDNIFTGDYVQSTNISIETADKHYLSITSVSDSKLVFSQVNINGNNNYAFTSAGGETSLIPIDASAGVEGDYIYGTIFVSKEEAEKGFEFKVVQKAKNMQFWYGYEAIENDSTTKGFCTSSYDGYSNFNIRINDSGTYRVMICKANSTYGVPTIKIESSDVIRIRYNNGSTTIDSEDIQKNDPYYKLMKPNFPGYTFEGWYFDPSLNNKCDDDDLPLSTSCTLYAKLIANEYNISYDFGIVKDAKEQDSYPLPDTYVYGAEGTISIPGIIDPNNHYEFVGWYYDEDFTQKVTSLNTKHVDGYTLYGKWKEATFDITYHLNGGINDKDNPSFITYNATETIEINDPTRTGFEFVGWYTTSTFEDRSMLPRSGTKSTLRRNIEKSVEIYAKWNVKAIDTVSVVIKTGSNEVEKELSTNMAEEKRINLDYSSTPQLIAKVNLTVPEEEVIKDVQWVNADFRNGYYSIENVISDSEYYVPNLGKDSVYICVKIRIKRTGEVSDYMFYEVKLSVYNQSYENKAVQWDGTSHADLMTLSKEYVDVLKLQNISFKYEILKGDTFVDIGPADAVEVGAYRFRVLFTNDETNEVITEMTKEATLTITKAVKVIINGAVFVFDGNEQKIEIPDGITPTGTISATEIGNYSFIATINDTAHYMWSDGTSDPKTFDWYIVGKSVNVPNFSVGENKDKNIYYYNTQEQQFDLSLLKSDDFVLAPDGETVTIGGITYTSTSKATDVGTYYIILQLKDTSNSMWSNGSTSNQVFEWKIEKGNPVVKENPVASELSNRNKLNDATLSGGKMIVTDINGVEHEVKGTFSWKKPDTVVFTFDTDKTYFDVVFTPTDGDKFNTATTSITIKVLQKQLAIDNVKTPLIASKYYSSYENIGVITIDGGEVQDNDGNIVPGIWDWAKTNDKYKKYTLGDTYPKDGKTYIEVKAIFTPDDNVGYSSIEMVVELLYEKNSSTVTLKGNNSHIDYYKVTYYGNPDGTVEKKYTVYVYQGATIEIEVLPGSRTLNFEIPNGCLEEDYSFKHIRIECDKDITEQTSKTFEFNADVNKSYTMRIVTLVKSYHLYIANPLPEGITAIDVTANIENEDGGIVSVKVNNGDLVPAHSPINVTYSISKGYRLTASTAIVNGDKENLIKELIKDDDIITDNYKVSFFMSNVGNVTISGETEDIPIKYSVNITGSGSGKIFIYINGEYKFQLTKSNEIKSDLLRKGDFISILVFADDNNCIEAVTKNNEKDSTIGTLKPVSKTYEYDYDTLLESGEKELIIGVIFKTEKANWDLIRIGKITANDEDIKIYELVKGDGQTFEEQFRALSKKGYSYYIKQGADYYIRLGNVNIKDCKTNVSAKVQYTLNKIFSNSSNKIYRIVINDVSLINFEYRYNGLKINFSY